MKKIKIIKLIMKTALIMIKIRKNVKIKMVNMIIININIIR